MFIRADLVDSVRERWRINDRAEDSPAVGFDSVRDQGEILTPVTDFLFDGSDIIALVSAAGEPLTYHFAGGINTLSEHTLERLLTVRGPLEPSDIDLLPLASIYSNFGVMAGRRAPVREYLEKYLRGVGGYATLRRDGVIVCDALLHPTAPSPYGGGCLEFISGLDDFARLEWAFGSTKNWNDFTFGCWAKFHRRGPSASGTGEVPIVDTSGDLTTAGLILTLDTSRLAPRFVAWRRTDGVTCFGDYPESQEVGWHFVAVVRTSGTGVKIYAAPQGGTLAEVGSSVDWTGTVDSDSVQLGAGFNSRRLRGSYFQPFFTSSAMTLAALQAQMDNGGAPASPEFYAELASLAPADTEDQAGSIAPTVTGRVHARPDLTVDLRITPRPWTEKKLRPAKRIEVRFGGPNPVLGPAEIAPAATATERAEAQAEWDGAEVWPNPEIGEDYKDAKEKVYDTPWIERNGAQATMRLARARFGEDHYFAALGRREGSPLRQGLTLETGDEVRVYGHGDMTSGPVYRVASNRVSFNDLDCELGLWR